MVYRGGITIEDRVQIHKNSITQCVTHLHLKQSNRKGDQSGDPFILINSAGLGGAFHFEQLPYRRFDDTMKINVYGTRNAAAALVPCMKKAGGLFTRGYHVFSN